jgi:8-oxo-dGTP pyrophosphatase MutT (NUDIX family)
MRKTMIARMPDQPAVPALPAATVILLRDGANGLETLLLRRNAKLAFHGGAWVFPGGIIDPEDYPVDATDDILAAACRAAVREAHEEAGLVLACEDLVFFSHWTTPEGRPQRFAAWFFVAVTGDSTVQIDGDEIHAHRWMQPSHALAAQHSGDIELPPPTFVTLTKLAAYGSVSETLASISAQTPETFFPRFVPVPDGAYALYAEDAGYEMRVVDRPGPRHRLWMCTNGWRYERSDG